jgi:nitroreductase
MLEKPASTDYPIHELLARRWSPYAFDDRSVSEADLLSLFEAARWAASSFNEQPWSYIVATKEHPDQFQQVLSCLVEFNQVWAKHAPVLALGIASLTSARNGQVNRAAVHDLGLGIFPDKARQLFDIPEGFEAWTAIAIGYRGEPTSLPEALQERERLPRQRKPLRQFVFSGKWGDPSPFVLRP